ncbi:hypothetical protein GCM10022234_23080 [Aeromicrobium panaciterrae]|uniref:hypothetical protein n=1 Tax=Aeromicrobium panaciterrae TaxID=363861 RepID=UPI0031DB2DF7
MTFTIVAPTRRHVASVLAIGEARRLLLHPAMLVGWALLAVVIFIGLISGNPVTTFGTITTGAVANPGVFCILAAHMLVTRDARAGTSDMTDVAPATRRQRGLALLIAAWAPALVALAINLAAHTMFLLTDSYVQAPGPAHIVQAPVAVLGGTLLGIMLGVWAPARVTPIVAMTALISFCLVLDGGSGGRALFSPAQSWADWGPGNGEQWYALIPGHPGAHVAYLLGLCAMAAAATWFRLSARHRAVSVALGTVAIAIAAVGGWAQLP